MRWLFRVEWRAALVAVLIQPLVALVLTKVPFFKNFPGLVFVVDALYVAYYAGPIAALVASAAVVYIAGDVIGMQLTTHLTGADLTAAFLIAGIGGIAISRAFIRDREARKETAESEQRFRRLLESTFDAVILSCDGRVVEVSSGFERLWGYSAGDATGRMLLEFVSPESAQDLVRHLADRSTDPIELEIVSRDGATHAVRVVSQNVGYHGRPARLAAITDISAERAAEHERAVVEQRYRTLFEAVPVGVTLATIDGVYLEANDVFCTLAGRSRDEVVGHHFTEFIDSLTSRNPDVRDAILAGESGPFEFESAILTPEGVANPVHVGIAVVRGLDGEPLYSVAVNESVAERRSLEAQVRQTQKMEAIGRLASGIAHDFNNLLTVIGGNVMLLDSVALPTEARRRVEEIGTASERAASLTRQLLTFSRQREPRFDEIPLNEVVEEVVDGLLRRLIGANVEVESNLDASVGHVLGDAIELEQVLINLAVNARDAMPDGGRLLIATKQEDEYVVLRVSDDGTGMDEATRDRIFEPFFTTKPRGEGTGLGLSNVYGIVHRMGGSISVDTAPGAGTTFSIAIPMPVAEEAEAAPTNMEDVGRRSARVLFVDDEPAVRRLAEAALERAGHRLVLAADAHEALELLDDGEPFDLLVTDLEMPGMNGLELAERVRALRPQLGVLFISGFPERVLSAGDTDGIDLLEKPFAPNILLERIARALPV